MGFFLVVKANFFERVKMAKKKIEQELLDMKLHKTMKVGSIVIFKVIGGWIYWNECLAKGAMAGVFVPNREEILPFLRKFGKELKQSKR